MNGVHMQYKINIKNIILLVILSYNFIDLSIFVLQEVHYLSITLKLSKMA